MADYWARSASGRDGEGKGKERENLSPASILPAQYNRNNETGPPVLLVNRPTGYWVLPMAGLGIAFLDPVGGSVSLIQHHLID